MGLGRCLDINFSQQELCDHKNVKSGQKATLRQRETHTRPSIRKEWRCL